LDQSYYYEFDKKNISYGTRVNTVSTSSTGYPELSQVDSVSTGINLHHIVYIRYKDGLETIFIDGQKVASGFRPGNFASWKDDYFLKLGNDNNMSSWNGSFFLLQL